MVPEQSQGTAALNRGICGDPWVVMASSHIPPVVWSLLTQAIKFFSSRAMNCSSRRSSLEPGENTAHRVKDSSPADLLQIRICVFYHNGGFYLSVSVGGGLGSPGRGLLCCRITSLGNFSLQQHSDSLAKTNFLSTVIIPYSSSLPSPFSSLMLDRVKQNLLGGLNFSFFFLKLFNHCSCLKFLKGSKKPTHISVSNWIIGNHPHGLFQRYEHNFLGWCLSPGLLF